MPNDNSSLMHLKFVLGHQHRNREIIWPVANKKIQTKNTNSISEQQFDRNFSKWSSSECLSILVKKKIEISFIY